MHYAQVFQVEGQWSWNESKTSNWRRKDQNNISSIQYAFIYRRRRYATGDKQFASMLFCKSRYLVLLTQAKSSIKVWCCTFVTPRQPMILKRFSDWLKRSKLTRPCWKCMQSTSKDTPCTILSAPFIRCWWLWSKILRRKFYSKCSNTWLSWRKEYWKALTLKSSWVSFWPNAQLSKLIIELIFNAFYKINFILAY